MTSVNPEISYIRMGSGPNLFRLARFYCNLLWFFLQSLRVDKERLNGSLQEVQEQFARLKVRHLELKKEVTNATPTTLPTEPPMPIQPNQVFQLLRERTIICWRLNEWYIHNTCSTFIHDRMFHLMHCSIYRFLSNKISQTLATPPLYQDSFRTTSNHQPCLTWTFFLLQRRTTITHNPRLDLYPTRQLKVSRLWILTTLGQLMI